jgi:predicted ATP-grasp superfamily ATP-dependent carboligase
MQTLIVVGASVRAVAFSALKAGFSPYAIDLYADRDLAAVCPAVKVASYPRGFVAALEKGPDAPWIYTGGLENYPRLVDQMAEMRPLLGNRGDVLRKVRQPRLVAEAVREAGVAFPEVDWVGEANRKWLVKPRRGSGGLGVRFATDRDLGRPQRGAYLQRYVEGEAASAIFVAAKERAVLVGATRQLLGRDFGLAPEFVYAGSIGPLTLRPEEIAKLQRLGEVLAERFGLVGLFNVDLVRTGEQLWVVEVNPRYSASIEVLERVTNFDSIGWHVAACQQRKLPRQLPAAKGFAGKAIVYAKEDGIVPVELETVCSAALHTPYLADLPRVGEELKAGQPVVTVFGEGETMEAVAVDLRERVAAVDRVLSTGY